MSLKLYNTLTRKKQTFIPLHKGKVGMYSCGPTVYNYAHIGNLRTYIFNDILKRSLLFLGYKVKHIMNITDVDDKTIKGSQKEHLPLKEFTQKYEDLFFEDLVALNIKKPEQIIKATSAIKEMVKLIKDLMKKGYAYKTEDGIYFSISKFKNYGKLAQLEKTQQNKTKARIKNDEYEKENIQDFALWKFYSPEDGDVFWETEIGKGRPGWHIECSAMSMKSLGKTFDIHTGAVDLIFPHHTNEIAQSESVTRKKFVNYWLHGGFLTMKNGKMSKSVGNVLHLNDIIKLGFSPLDYRYMCLTTHYKSQLLFSTENLDSAKNSYERLKNICIELKENKKVNQIYLNQFKKAIEDDLDMPKAIQILWNLLRDKKANGKYQTIKKIDEILGLKLLEKKHLELPIEVKLFLEQRENARKNKNFKLADELRNKIVEFGFTISDTSEGPVIKKI